MDVGKNHTIFTKPSDRELVATRRFDAPRRLVWEAHTVPRHVRSWLLGPGEATMPVCEIELRPGGAWHYLWKFPKGNSSGMEQMEMRGEFREIVPPERLVNTEAWGGDWAETVNTMLLTEEGGTTTLTATVLYPTQAARDRALATGMTDGWAASYDRLDAYLQEQLQASAGAPGYP